jgi:hypothetical protein
MYKPTKGDLEITENTLKAITDYLVNDYKDGEFEWLRIDTNNVLLALECYKKDKGLGN